jgi:putative phosphoribosyl transferase
MQSQNMFSGARRVTLFVNRTEAGQRLAEALKTYAGREDVIVLALPRGGVPVAYQVAQFLNAPLDIFLVRKLGVPGREELAMGAIASGGVRVLNQSVVEALNIPGDIIIEVSEREQNELERREQTYRGSRLLVEIQGKTVILIDDGLATGASMRAAVTGLRQLNPAQIIVAVPTASLEACQKFEALVERTVCLATPEPFRGVGEWYGDFSQTSDEEVRELLQQAAGPFLSVP